MKDTLLTFDANPYASVAPSRVDHDADEHIDDLKDGHGEDSASAKSKKKKKKKKERKKKASPAVTVDEPSSTSSTSMPTGIKSDPKAAPTPASNTSEPKAQSGTADDSIPPELEARMKALGEQFMLRTISQSYGVPYMSSPEALAVAVKAKQAKARQDAQSRAAGKSGGA